MMHLQIRGTNVEIPLPERLEIEKVFRQAFDRFNHCIREAQLTLRDTNGPKGGVDKLCTIQLRLYPRGLAVVKNSATSFPQAANAACDRMQEVVATRLNKSKSSRLRNSRIKFDENMAYRD